MKVPFRQQASNYDCVPTTFINALNYLFPRSDIPPFIVHRVYKECLDAKSSRGTTSRAIRELGYLLNTYVDKRFKNFTVESQYICGAQVNLDQNSKIIRCINEKGAALLNVHSSRNSWHYILGFGIEDGWLHCYDPSPRTRRFIKNNAIQFDISSEQQEPNLLIRCDWLDKTVKKTKNPDNHKYILGTKDNRECLLLKRVLV